MRNKKNFIKSKQKKKKQKEGKTDAKPIKSNDAPAVIDADDIEIEENEFISAFTATGASAGTYDAKQADEQVLIRLSCYLNSDLCWIVLDCAFSLVEIL